MRVSSVKLRPYLEGHLATAHLAVQQGGAVLVEQRLNAARSTSYFLSCSIYVMVASLSMKYGLIC